MGGGLGRGGGAGGTTTGTPRAGGLAAGFGALPPAMLILWYCGSVLPLFNATRITASGVRTRVPHGCLKKMHINHVSQPH